MISVEELLAISLAQAEQLVSKGNIISPSEEITSEIDIVLKYSEAAKAVCTVVITSLVYKILHPEQDIRRHQAGIDGGYSGRSFDSHYITPFLKRNRFPSMAESGWLTRSLEQKVPYDKDYTGAISPVALKSAFLRSIDYIQHSSTEEQKGLLSYILCQLIVYRERNNLTLATPNNLSIKQLLLLLERHFSRKYRFEGASRLPTLALYAIYQILIQEMTRFQGCTLMPLESHTSADRRSGRLGDIDVVDSLGLPFESVEIKYQIPVSLSMVETAHEKFMGTSLKRYYILSTACLDPNEVSEIDKRVNDIKNTHGCQVIVNGIYTTLNYYLRLIQEPSSFVRYYTQLLQEDKAIKYEHKTAWNDIVLEMFSSDN